jgi:hypothetical protein
MTKTRKPKKMKNIKPNKIPFSPFFSKGGVARTTFSREILPPLLKGAGGILKPILLTLLLLPALTTTAKSYDFSIGLGYPYITIKDSSKLFAGELKGAFGKGIQIYAVRGYWYFLDRDYLRLFTGAEVGYVNFDDVYDLSGRGWEAGIFAGIETFTTDWMSVSLDFSPTYIRVQSSGKRDYGFEYIINLAIYIYPFKTKRSYVVHIPKEGKIPPSPPLLKGGEEKPKPEITLPADKDLSSFAQEPTGEPETKPDETEYKPIIAPKLKPIPTTQQKTQNTQNLILTEDIEIID